MRGRGKKKSRNKWKRPAAEDRQRQIAWVMTVDRLSYTLKHKRGNLAMWASGAQIIYQIEYVPILNISTGLAGFLLQDNINGDLCPQTVVKIKPQARENKDNPCHI